MTKRIILGINVVSFASHSGDVQKVLSEFGHCIRTRLGLHEAACDTCSPGGLILLEFVGGKDKADELAKKLGELQGVEVKMMEF